MEILSGRLKYKLIGKVRIKSIKLQTKQKEKVNSRSRKKREAQIIKSRSRKKREVLIFGLIAAQSFRTTSCLSFSNKC